MRLVEVVGDSMAPTLSNGDFLLLKSKIKWKRFEIVAFEYMDKILVKRLVGLPGETILVDNGLLIADDVKVDSGYLSYGNHFWELDKDHVILLGDNSANSLDSRSLGPIPIKWLKGRVLMRIWPPCKLFL